MQKTSTAKPLPVKKDVISLNGTTSQPTGFKALSLRKR